MAILVTTLCERADDHGGHRRPMAALWPHSRRHTALRNHTKKQVNVVKSRSRFDRWKAWSQLVLRVNQYNGASGSNKKNFAIWSKMVRLDSTMMVSTEPKRRPTSMRVSRRRLRFWAQ